MTLPLDEWERLAAAATPGPWRHRTTSDPTGEQYSCVTASERAPGRSPRTIIVGDTDYTDAAFIAAARDAVPALVAEVRRLRAARPDPEGLPVDLERAREALCTLVAIAFRRPDAPSPRFHIPAQQDDDDLVLGNALRELARLRAVAEATRAHVNNHGRDDTYPALERAIEALDAQLKETQ
jgi:hypothetical protein